MSQDDPERLTLQVLKRLEFIEFRLFWEGQVNRSDLTRRFEISVPQASVDLTRYQTLVPGNITYDKTRRGYVTTESFMPRLLRPVAERYLADLRLLSAGVSDLKEVWSSPPEHDALRPAPRIPIDVELLRKVLQAIRQRRRINILYRSKSAIDPQWRWIAPHAVAFDGDRWHARSWCYEHHEFRDFVFNRMMSFSDLRKSEINSDLDFEWSRDFELRLAPNPGLTEEQRGAIELDFGMQDSELRIRSRLSLTPYYRVALRVRPSRQPHASAPSSISVDPAQPSGTGKESYRSSQ